MKRILILVTVVLIGVALPAWGRSRCYYTTLGGIRYSPYAFGFGHNGLIPDTLHYSPYAGGLVHEFFVYSPYAFDTHHNGLISSVADFYAPALGWVYAQESGARLELIDALGDLTRAIRQSQGNWACAYVPRGGRTLCARSTRPVTVAKAQTQPDPYLLVRQHLQETMPGQFQITRLLRIGGEAVSFDVVLKNSNTVIKYWNPEKFASIRAQTDGKQKVLDRYLKTWARFANDYEMNGGTIYHLSSNDSEQVIAKLTTFTELKPGYAIAKN